MTKILITKLKGIIGNGVKYLHEGELARKDKFERPMVKLGDKGESQVDRCSKNSVDSHVFT